MTAHGNTMGTLVPIMMHCRLCASARQPARRQPRGRYPVRSAFEFVRRFQDRCRSDRSDRLTGPGERRVLYVIVCAAGPAGEVGRLIALAQDRGWEVQVVATPSALAFLDVPQLELQTRSPVRSEYRRPGEPKSPRADAIIVAPATFNTINKFATGISDTYALGILAEAPGLGIPVVILPFVNAALAQRIPWDPLESTCRHASLSIL